MHGCIIAEVVQFVTPRARMVMPEQMSRRDPRFQSPVSVTVPVYSFTQ